MKKLLSFICLAVIGLWLTAFRPAPEPFEGMIRFDVSIIGSNQGDYAAKMPKYYVLRFKGNSMKMSGGTPMLGEMLFKKDEQKLYILRADQRITYQLNLKDKRMTQSDGKSKAVLLNETATIAGYTCRKYLIEGKGGLKQHIWATNEIEIQGFQSAAQFPQASYFFTKGVEGFPLKIQIETPQLTVVSTASVVRRATLSATDFALPPGFSLKNLL
jgi:hypothetical protein